MQMNRVLFRRCLKQKNIPFVLDDYVLPESQQDMEAMLAEIRSKRPDLILTMGSVATLLVKEKIKDVPVVFCMIVDPSFNNLKDYYVEKGDGYTMRMGLDTYMPGVQLKRDRVPHHLDVFVESQSPFTVQVEGELMKFLSETDVKDLTFSMHYIAQETVKGDESASASAKSPSTGVRAAPLKQELKTVDAGPLTSRRGEEEIREDMRQVCLFQHSSIGTFFTYLACRNQNVSDATRGEKCLQMSDPLKKCLEGPEAENLLRQDARLVRELGITAGPVFLWENRYGPFGWYQADWKKLVSEGK